MLKTIDKIDINYEQMGKGDDIVLLHGWGQNIEMMMPLAKHLKTKFRVTIIDLPGFGLSNNLDRALSVYDYVELLHKLLIELKIKKPSLIGHSFGGKLSIVYASKYEVDKLVLLGSPVFASDKTKRFKTKFLKFVKKLPLMHYFENLAKSYIGSADYKNASPLLREILVKTVNTDVSKEAASLQNETLLIWGDNDEAASLKDAQKLEELIKESALIVLEGASHYAYLERIVQVNAILDNFL